MKILIILCAVLLSGCSLVAGKASYSLKPFVADDGSVICCEAKVFNSKDYESLSFSFSKNADGSVSAKLNEKGVSATDPSAVQAENNSKLLDAVTKLIPLK